MTLPVLSQQVEQNILLIRGHRVMLDADLAKLYGVSTKRLNEQVQRNKKRFPSDFMFQLTPEEVERLRSQIATSKIGSGGRRYRPYALTEQGVAMLSSVLHSERAIQVNIAIMRAFVQLREMISSNKGLARRLNELEKKYEGTARCPPCSQNARPRKALVRCAQSRATLATPLWRGRERTRMGGHPRWSCVPGTEEGMEPDDLLCSRNARSRTALARANGTSRRASGWAGEKVARSGRSISPHPWEVTSEL